MITMFERYTDRARRAVVLAQEEARARGHNYIGPEHLILGLLHEGEGVAAQVLQSLGLSLDKHGNELASAQASETPISGHIPFTADTKKAMESSLREALQLGHNFIGTEHLLLGLVRNGGKSTDSPYAFFATHGIEISEVRKRVIQLLSGYIDAPTGEGHVQQLLMHELQSLDSKIAVTSKELERLQAARAEVIAHLTPQQSGETAAS